MAASIQLTVNGRLHRVDADPRTPLLYVLRNDLGLKSVKFGCGLEQCGACAVLVGEAVILSCGVELAQVSGRRITTLEGLGTPGRPHPLQRAFLEENAAQCGYCTAGILVAAKALLDRHPDPGEDEIRRALAGHLCRCGAHPRILRAIRRAAAELRA